MGSQEYLSLFEPEFILILEQGVALVVSGHLSIPFKLFACFCFLHSRFLRDTWHIFSSDIVLSSYVCAVRTDL